MLERPCAQNLSAPAQAELVLVSLHGVSNAGFTRASIWDPVGSWSSRKLVGT